MRRIVSLSLLLLAAGLAFPQSQPLDSNTMQYLRQMQQAPVENQSMEIRKLQETIQNLQARITQLEERIKKLESPKSFQFTPAPNPQRRLLPNPDQQLLPNPNGQPRLFLPNPNRFPMYTPDDGKGTKLPNGGFFRPLSPASQQR